MTELLYETILSLKRELVRRASIMYFKYDLSDIIDIQDGELTIVFLRQFISTEWRINDKGEEEEILVKKPVMWMEVMDGQSPRLVVPYPQFIFTIDALGKIGGVNL